MAVTSQILEQGDRNVVMHFTNDGGGTPDEFTAAVLKVDVSALSPPAARVSIRKIKWSIVGAAGENLRILWDATADDVAWIMPAGSNDTHDFRDVGDLQNPMSAGWTGDINFQTSVTAVAYSVTLWMKKKDG